MPPRAVILRSYLQTRYRRPFRSREHLATWQDRQVRRLLRWVLPHSLFYRQRFDGRSPADWPHIEVMDKATMMAHFDTLNTVGIRKEDALRVALAAEASRDFAPVLGGITVGLSSGTSGNRGLFLVAPQERYRWTGAMLAKMLPGSLWEAHRVAFFLRANSNLYTTVRSRRLRFSYFDLLDPLEQHLAALKTLQPTILVAPPSMLRLLAEAIDVGGLRITPRRVISVAETLDPLDEAVIRRAFGRPIHQVYQCTEGFLGCTCLHGTLHLNEDLVVIQKDYLDEEHRKFVPIITDFNRTTQPIIRYRLEDILTERATPCPCGSVLIALDGIEGRCDDLLFFPAQEGSVAVRVFPDFIRRALITADERIDAYRVWQRTPDLLEVALTPPAAEHPALCRAVEASFHALFERLGCRAPRLHFVAMTMPPDGQKLRRVIRCFDPADAAFHPAGADRPETRP